MRIIPNSDILIAGNHSTAGEVVVTTDAIGWSLVAQGLAKIAPAEKIKDELVVETASIRGGKKITAAKTA